MTSPIICESMTLSLEQNLCCIDLILSARLQELTNVGTIGSHGCRVSLPHHHHLLLCRQFRVRPRKRSMHRWHRQSLMPRSKWLDKLAVLCCPFRQQVPLKRHLQPTRLTQCFQPVFMAAAACHGPECSRSRRVTGS